MPKRSLDVPTVTQRDPTARVPPVKVLKTERSHEENQERAYIAASRRADRSLEARIQSAKMASEIHRRRTGRGLKVTEDIVVKEEMYEEEEDDMPRQYMMLTQHLQTNSPAMNSRVNAYITTQTAMATMARYNEINKLFNESFPSAMGLSQQLNQSIYMAPLMNNGKAPFSPASQSESMSSPSTHSDMKFDNMARRVSTATTSVSSPPPLSPTSGTTETVESRGTPYQHPAQLPRMPQQQTSSFTSELPNEIKMMANIDRNDPAAPYLYGSNPWSFAMYDQNFDMESSKFQHAESGFDVPRNPASPHDSPESFVEDNLDESLTSPLDSLDGHFSFGQDSNANAGMADNFWNSYIDFGGDQ